MTDISKLKHLDPKLYDDLLDFERDLYSVMEKKTEEIIKIRNLLLKGMKKEARELFKELKKPEHIGPG